MKLKAIVVLGLFFSWNALAVEGHYLAADYFDAIRADHPRPSSWPVKAQLLEEGAVDEKAFAELIEGTTWRLGHTCSGFPIPIERYFGKDLPGGQSSRQPLRGMSIFGDQFSHINFGYFAGPTLDPSIGEVVLKCKFATKPLQEGFFLLYCPEDEEISPIVVKPILVLKEDGSREVVLRTSELKRLTPYVCPQGTQLFGIYSNTVGY